MNWKEFLELSYQKAQAELDDMANNLIKLSLIKNNEIVVDAGAGLGLISKNILKLGNNIKIIAIDNDITCINELKNSEAENFEILNCDLENIKLENKTVNKVISRSSLMHCLSKKKVLKEIYRILKNDGQISMHEPIAYDKLDRYYKYLLKDTPNYFSYKNIEEKVRNDIKDPLTNYDVNTLKNDLLSCGFKNIHILQIPAVEFFKFDINIEQANLFYMDKPHKFALKDKFLQYMTEKQFNIYYNELERQTINKNLCHKVIKLYIFAQKQPSFFSQIRLNLKILQIFFSKVLIYKLKYMLNIIFKRNLFWY